MTEKKLPTWVKPIELDGWSTTIVTSQDLFYRLPLCERWNQTPEIEESSVDKEHRYKGYFASEWLVVNFMEVDKQQEFNLRNWVDSLVAMGTFPIPILKEVVGENPELMTWEYEGEFTQLNSQLGVKESHLYSGLAMLPLKPRELARLYVLLARREQYAWKVTLSFMSACLPGTPEEEVTSNDHVRAGATFGGLQFL